MGEDKHDATWHSFFKFILFALAAVIIVVALTLTFLL